MEMSCRSWAAMFFGFFFRLSSWGREIEQFYGVHKKCSVAFWFWHYWNVKVKNLFFFKIISFSRSNSNRTYKADLLLRLQGIFRNYMFH